MILQMSPVHILLKPIKNTVLGKTENIRLPSLPGYLKLRNLEFGYTFPKEWLQKCRINSLRLYLAGQNLFTLTNVPIDPEVSAGNGTAYPSMRIINLGLTLKF